MVSRRVARVQDLIKEEVSRLLLYKAKDPVLSEVTVTGIKMTGDLKRAVIFYSLLSEKAERAKIEAGLVRAKGFIRREVGRVAGLKYVPEILFEFDRGLEYARHMDKVLKEIDPGPGDSDDNRTV